MCSSCARVDMMCTVSEE